MLDDKLNGASKSRPRQRSRSAHPAPARPPHQLLQVKSSPYPKGVARVAPVTGECLVHGYLTENPHTRDLHPRVINTLAKLSRPRHFEEGEYLFKQGDAADHVYLLRGGSVWLQSHNPSDGMHVWTIDAGEIVGWSCLTPPYLYLLDARAASTLETIELDARALRERIPNDHELGFEIYQILLEAAAKRLTPHSSQPRDRTWPHPLIW